MRHFKILGWLWVLFGGYWSLHVVLAILMDALIAPGPPSSVTISPRAWWGEFIGNTLEISFFLASALLGVGLLRRWRRAHVVAAILGAFALALYFFLASRPSFPPHTLAENMLFLSPLAILGLYSLILFLFVRYESRMA
jgi:hypothetical protein